MDSTDSVHTDLINEQPSDIITAWKTLLLSSIDANASELKLRTESHYSLVVDVESTTAKPHSTDLSKLFRDNISLHETIQILAQGKITVISDQSIVHYDIKKNTAVQTTISDPLVGITDSVWIEAINDLISKHETTGVSVCIIPGTMSNWEPKLSELKSQLSFVNQVCSTDVLVNEQRITGRDFNLEGCSKYTVDDTPMFSRLTISESDTISVYSNGIYVTEIYDMVFSGSIILLCKIDLQTYNNMCAAEDFSQVFSKIEQEKLRLCGELSYTEYTATVREFMAKRMFEDSTALETTWGSKYLFSSPSDSLYSLEQINDAESIGFSTYGNDIADSLEERGHIILNKNDPAVEQLQGNTDWYTSVDLHTLYEQYTEKDDTVLNVSELSRNQRIKLGVARYISMYLHIDRTVLYGSSEDRNAWTDGHSYIVITDSAMSSNKWIQWVPELFRVLLHEYSHTQEIMSCSPNHGNAFAQNYRKNIDSKWSELADIIGEINTKGVQTFDIGYTEKTY